MSWPEACRKCPYEGCVRSCHVLYDEEEEVEEEEEIS